MVPSHSLTYARTPYKVIHHLKRTQAATKLLFLPAARFSPESRKSLQLSLILLLENSLIWVAPGYILNPRISHGSFLKVFRHCSRFRGREERALILRRLCVPPHYLPLQEHPAQNHCSPLTLLQNFPANSWIFCRRDPCFEIEFFSVEVPSLVYSSRHIPLA